MTKSWADVGGAKSGLRGLIETTMDHIFGDFKQSVRDMGQLCDLKSLSFEGGRFPDYRESNIQQLYLLRYLPAYIAEYYFIMDQAMDNGLIEPPISVLSIGCGAGIDCAGFRHALTVAGHDPESQFEYHGIDAIEWDYWGRLGNAAYDRSVRDIANLSRFDRNDYNVICFPKSLSEFDAKTYRHLKTMIEDTEWTSDQILLAGSFRVSYEDKDFRRFESLLDLLCEVHGYDYGEDSNLRNVSSDDTLFSEFPEFFTFPQHIIDYLRTLLDNCEGYQEEGKEPHEADCDRLNRIPILTMRHFSCRLVGLTR